MAKCDICSKVQGASTSEWRTISHRELKANPQLISHAIAMRLRANPDSLYSIGWNTIGVKLEDLAGGALPERARSFYLASVERQFGESDWLLCPDCSTVHRRGDAPTQKASTPAFELKGDDKAAQRRIEQRNDPAVQKAIKRHAKKSAPTAEDSDAEQEADDVSTETDATPALSANEQAARRQELKERSALGVLIGVPLGIVALWGAGFGALSCSGAEGAVYNWIFGLWTTILTFAAVMATGACMFSYYNAISPPKHQAEAKRRQTWATLIGGSLGIAFVWFGPIVIMGFAGGTGTIAIVASCVWSLLCVLALGGLWMELRTAFVKAEEILKNETPAAAHRQLVQAVKKLRKTDERYRLDEDMLQCCAQLAGISPEDEEEPTFEERMDAAKRIHEAAKQKRVAPEVFKIFFLVATNPGDDDQLRLTALDILGECAGRDPGAFGPEIFKNFLLVATNSDEDDELRLRALGILSECARRDPGAFGTAHQAIYSGLSSHWTENGYDRDDKVGKAIMQTMRDIDPDQFRDMVKGLAVIFGREEEFAAQFGTEEKARSREPEEPTIRPAVDDAPLSLAGDEPKRAGAAAPPKRGEKLQSASAGGETAEGPRPAWHRRLLEDAETCQRILDAIRMREQIWASHTGMTPKKVPDGSDPIEQIAQCCLRDMARGAIAAVENKEQKGTGERLMEEASVLLACVRAATADEAVPSLQKRVLTSNDPMYVLWAKSLLACIRPEDHEAKSPPERIRCTCPSCGKGINAAPSAAGKTVRCPACKTPFTVPATTTAKETATSSTSWYAGENAAKHTQGVGGTSTAGRAQKPSVGENVGKECPEPSRAVNALIAESLQDHLRRMKDHYIRGQGFSAMTAYWDQLLESAVMSFCVNAIHELLGKSIATDSHQWTANRFGGAYIAVSTIPAVDPSAARAYFTGGYLAFLQELFNESDFGTGDVHLVHWIYCYDGDRTSAHLTFFPSLKTTKSLGPKGVHVFAQDLMTAVEKSEAGIG